MYFKPNRLENEGGVDPIFRGALYFPAQEVDLKMVDEMRNTLFPTSAAAPGKPTGFDLASLNIQRGRDHGLADFNTVRRSLNLKPYESFDEITKDTELNLQLKELYGDINNIDLWVGGLAEEHVHNSELGETFHSIVVEQFTRIRDGDRFWYQLNLTSEEIKMVESTTMGEIIRFNTGFDDCPENVFFSKQNCDGVKDHQCIPRPSKQSEEVRQLNSKNSKLQSDNDDKQDKLRTLIIITCVLAGITLLVIICAIKVAVTRNQGDDPIEKAEVSYQNKTNGNASKKPAMELGETNKSLDV